MEMRRWERPVTRMTGVWPRLATHPEYAALGSPAVQGDSEVGEPPASSPGFGRRQALVSKGPGGARCKLGAGQLRALEALAEALRLARDAGDAWPGPGTG